MPRRHVSFRTIYECPESLEHELIRQSLTVITICTLGLLLPFRSSAQTSCLSGDDVTSILARVKESPAQSLNLALKDELLERKAKGEKRLAAVAIGPENKSNTERTRKFQEENTAHLCE